MLSPLRNRFGIPGVISVIALVFAMFGGAYAASNDSSSGSKASASAKKGPRGPRGPKGPAGPAGAQGPAGPAGAKGDTGAAGSNGSNGSNGVSVASEEFGTGGKDGKCVGTGGTKFTSASGSTYACNGTKGKEGNPWTTGGTLPEGESETGVWGVSATGFSFELAPISFPIPLANDLPEANVHFNAAGYEGAPGADCPGKASEPKAQMGHLCIYTHAMTNFAYAPFNGFPEVQNGGAGVVVAFASTEIGSAHGSWAVTAGP